MSRLIFHSLMSAKPRNKWILDNITRIDWTFPKSFRTNSSKVSPQKEMENRNGKDEDKTKRETHITPSLTSPIPNPLPQPFPFPPPFPILPIPPPQNLLHRRQKTRIIGEDVFAYTQNRHAAVRYPQVRESRPGQSEGLLADGEGGVC